MWRFVDEIATWSVGFAVKQEEKCVNAVKELKMAARRFSTEARVLMVPAVEAKIAL
jgi:hypothetical protein